MEIILADMLKVAWPKKFKCRHGEMQDNEEIMKVSELTTE